MSVRKSAKTKDMANRRAGKFMAYVVYVYTELRWVIGCQERELTYNSKSLSREPCLYV